MDEILRFLAPWFGLAIILFAGWDYYIDPVHGHRAALIRIAFVAVSMIAWRKTFLPWTPSQRSEFVFCMNSFAIILSGFVTYQGLHYSVVGATSGMFILAIIAGGVSAFVWCAIPPMLLYIGLSAMTLPQFDFTNGVVSYLLAFAIALVCMLIVRYLRRKAFFLEHELTQRASHDSLTGLFNRGQLNELGIREVAMARRHGRPLAIAMLDIDRFKTINDTYGHDIGDMALKALGQVCRDSVRKIDHVGRFGGEEFICIMPETAEEEALVCAERLRASVEAMRIDTPKGIVHFTVSVGVAMYDAAQPGWETLIRKADAAMYQAKQDGRNCVRLSQAASGVGGSPRLAATGV